MTLSLRNLASCAWCRRPFSALTGADGRPERYCSQLHQVWAVAVANGEYPVADCPRCGRHDLRIAAPDWGICQTCGFQTDRPNLEPGRITPANMFNDNSDIRERLAS